MNTAFDSEIEANGLPKSLHAEGVILGAMQLDALAVEDALRLLVPTDFSLDSHRRIFTAMRQLAERNEPIDIVTLIAELERRGEKNNIGGGAYLAWLSEGVPRKLNIESYARIVKGKAMSRETIHVCEQIKLECMAGTEEPVIVLSRAVDALTGVLAGVSTSETLEDQAEAEYELLQRQRRGEAKVFVTSGLSPYDDSHGGYALGETTIVGARPRVGKSTLMRQAIIANCEEGNFVHLFTPEMSAGQVLRALWAYLANVPAHKLRYPERMTQSEMRMVEAAKTAVKTYPLVIDPASPMYYTDILHRARAESRRRERQGLTGTKLMVVDYLQKLKYKGRSQDRHIEVTDAMVALTGYAKQQEVAMVIVSSLTEPTGKERNRAPSIDDLRQSGDIKFEANTILLLHRELDEETQKLAPECRLIVGKARSDADGSRTIYFDGAMQRFVGQDQFLKGMGR